ncbi:MAG: beta-propeller domain-containing protein [Candidatus Hydrogenedentota bacterium]
MRYTVRFVSLLLVAGLLAGCPFLDPSGNHRFTTADPNNRFHEPLLDAPANETDGEGEDFELGSGEEREVVEPDVIRRDGNLLYVLNQHRGLSIVDLDEQRLLAQVPTMGYPRDLYLVGDRAYVLVAGAMVLNPEAGEEELLEYNIQSQLYVVDVSTPASAAVLGRFGLDGDLQDSRLVGDVLYAISAEYTWSWVEDAVVKQQQSASWVTSVNVADPDNIYEADNLSFAGFGDVIQATNFAIFVAAPDQNAHTTNITYIDISDPAGAIVVRGTTAVPGKVPDRFKMDAYNGVLRVVSNTWRPERDVYVTTVDLADPDNLSTLGHTSIAGAAGETLFATRFDGPKAYVVTFLVVDPLFVLDLSDPANPIVAGELEVPGWSTHIEPQGDRLVALGVDDTDGRQVKVSLYDVSTPTAPAELDVISFGEGWAWSTAYNDVKAFTVLEDTLIVPFNGWSEEGGFDRLQFISYDRNSLHLRGHVDLQGNILRSFDYGGAFYGVTTEQVATIEGPNLDSLAVTGAVTLAEYVSHVLPLAQGGRAEIITRHDSGDTIVRCLDAEGHALGDTQVAMRTVLQAFATGDAVLLVATANEGESRYEVVKVDCTDPSAPSAAELAVTVPPYYPPWRWRPYPPMIDGPVLSADAAEVDSKMMARPPYYWPNTEPEHVFLAGNYLVLRCRQTDFDTTLGDHSAQQGYAVVDIAGFAWDRTVGLGFEEIVGVNGAKDNIYVTTKQEAASVPGRPRAAFYMREIAPDAEEAGPAANVPGAFLDYDPANGILLTQDQQYRLDNAMEYAIKSTRWDGGPVAELVDSFVLPQYYGGIEVSNGYVYIAANDDVFAVQGVRTETDGELAGAGKLPISRNYGYLAGANGPTAYALVGGRLLVPGDFSAEPPVAMTPVPLQAGVVSMRFDDTTAYLALGYAGSMTLPAMP